MCAPADAARLAAASMTAPNLAVAAPECVLCEQYYKAEREPTNANNFIGIKRYTRTNTYVFDNHT